MSNRTGLSQSELQKLARFIKRFGESTGVYISLYDASGEELIDFNCSNDEISRLDEVITPELVNDMLSRVAIDSIEDQAVENTSIENIKVAASAIKHQGRCRMIFIFAGVLEGYEDNDRLSVLKRRTQFDRFLETIDVLRELMMDKLLAQMSVAHSEEESRKSQYSANEMAESLRRVSSMTEILKFLDSDKNIEKLMEDYLEITADYLNTELAFIAKVKPENMDIIAQWSKAGKETAYDNTVNLPKLDFLEGSKPIILSTGSPFLNNLEDWNGDPIHAVVAMPIMLGDGRKLFLSYIEQTEDRNWKLDELQFLSDSSRILQSMLDKRIQKNSLASSYASLEQILENVGCAIVVHDASQEKVLFENQIMKKTFSTEKIHPKMGKILWDGTEKRELIEFHDERTGMYYEIKHNNISWVDGRPVALYAIYDVTDKKSYQRRIEQQAYTDFLTGLFNRLCCERDLAKIIDETQATGRVGALLYLDLDDFKHINDGLGHQYGDVLLKEISKRLSSIEGIERNCYRMGGDEFVIIIPPSSYSRYEKIIESIKTVFATPFYLKDAEYYCTMSMGIVAFSNEGDSVADLVQKADVAMYEAKKTGKNRVCVFRNGSMSDANKRLDMEKNMRKATAEGYGEFLVYYQPIIDISKEGSPCVGAEALVRWNSSELGFISPADFIPLAEYLGLINPIGDYILMEACKACKYWNTHGHPNYKVNVNLSVVQLMQNDIVQRIKKAIDDTKIDPKNLTLEVTESLAINDMDRMKVIMTDIRSLGVRIALDDFGTGYSSLNHIREIPLDVIKVDQSFVKDLVDNDYSKSFIRMVSELAAAIGVDICIEGIEKEAQIKVLEDMKVKMIQGYYFDKPMKKDDFMKKYI